MSYANSHIYLRILGHFGGASSPLDYWSTGLRLAIVGADVPYSPGNLQTFVDSLETPLKTFHTSTGTAAGQNTYVSELQAARIGPDGKYNPLVQTTVRRPFTATAGLGTPSQPWNSALVFSLRTNLSRGYASNGRVYYPMLSKTPDPTVGRLATADVLNRLGGFKTFLDAVNVAAATYATNMRVAVMSSVGAGLTALCTSVRSDTRYDSIERRENKQAPFWQSVTLA